MAGIASKLQHDREKAQGIGSNARAVQHLGQDFEALKASCLERGQLFQDDLFDAIPASLGFKDLGPNSSKVRGIKWMRPMVGSSVLGPCIFLSKLHLKHEMIVVVWMPWFLSFLFWE